MFCRNCGTENPDSSKFCKVCGSPMPSAQRAPSAKDAPAPDPAVKTPAPVKPVAPGTVKKGAGKGMLIAVICAVAVLLAAVVTLGILYVTHGGPDSEDTVTEEESPAAVTELSDEEKAELSSKELDVVRSLIGKGEYKKAKKLLSDMDIGPGSEYYDEYEKAMRVISLAETEPEVDTGAYPKITVTLDCDDKTAAVISGDADIPGMKITGEKAENGKISVTLTDEEISPEEKQRSIEIPFEAGGYTVTVPVEFTSPALSAADIRLVSTDVSGYPEVKAYFRVEDPETHSPVTGLDGKSFSISEKISGGGYVSREVHSAEMLGAHEGLNISLVADKSSSISNADMDKIKSVMRDFVYALNFSVGDRAEVLAFDDIVQQMCTYTGDTKLLINGINSMYNDGMTALYNAIHDGIYHSYLRGGARCVIAFTDGQDNESSYSYLDVVDYANANQVPVYIIGVGDDCDTGSLKYIAESTGGKYWFIDNLGNLQEIYREIYREQIDMYAVTYESDSNAAPGSERTLDVCVAGGGYYGECDRTFRPAETIAPKKHTSRYEVYREALTWEEAYARCEKLGGHLVTITSEQEQNTVIGLMTAQGVEMTWLGGYTSYDGYGGIVGHWITGEQFSYAPWGTDEPSRQDKDGTPEWYLMLWNIPRKGGWTWNDERNDPYTVNSGMRKTMGFVCEYED